MLKTGKQASRRIMHYALQSLLALFGENNTFISNLNTAEYFSLFSVLMLGVNSPLLLDSTELPKRLSMDSSSSLESLSSSQSMSQPHSLPHSFGCYPPQPSFLPPVCPDNLSCDAISVYSLSSLASSLSFLSRPEPAGSDVISQRSHQQDLDASRGGGAPYSSQRGPLRSRLTNHRGGVAGEGEEEEYEGYSIISSEPLGQGRRECDTLPLPVGHRHGKSGAGRGSGGGHGYPGTVSSKGSISTPTSPIKAPLLPPKVLSSPKPKHEM